MSASSAALSRDRGMVDGEFVMTPDDFQRISTMLHADAGIVLPESKATLVYSRLAKRLRVLGLESFREYCALVTGSEGADERQHMLSALTTNVTRFFREPHHFEHLKEKVLPPLLDQARRGGRVRIWSAACSSGQEPYSIALTILSMMPDAAKYDVRVLATDIDPNMVATGREGVYSTSALEPTPKPMRDKWFEPAQGGQWRAGEALRELVSFRELNLLGSWPMKGKFDAIFCRNVVIYFDEPTQNKIWSRFTTLLPPRGRLYIGHSERVAGEAANKFVTDGVTTYSLKA